MNNSVCSCGGQGGGNGSLPKFIFGYLADIFLENKLREPVISRKIVSFVANEEAELSSIN